MLVVDDEQVIREVLADFLSLEGFDVRTAENGQAALDELTQTRYDLVLSDLKMPTLDGNALLAQIRQRMPHVVTILMTGFGTVETAISAMKNGAFDYILKPFKMEEVVLTVQRALEQQRIKKENLRLQEALSLYKVSEAIAGSLSLEAVLATVVESAFDEVRADQVTILLKDPESRGDKASYFARVHLARSDLNREHPLAEFSPCVLLDYFKSEPRLLVHGSHVHAFLSGELEAPPTSLIVTPLRAKGDNIGFLCVGLYQEARRFDEGQRKLLQIIANRASAAIENARLYEDLKATFHQTIRGLANAIDKMDKYTAGHSERVATYAEMLAKRLVLNEDEVRIVRQSALLHDIGKIGCAMNLNKPGKLSQTQYEVFQQHPNHGRDILEPITFLNPLIPGVYLHHERWDGMGYPLGLAQEKIPAMARIISVADTYDAMTSDRAYRRALPHEVAVEEIKRCSGSQFDPEVAASFLAGLIETREAEAEQPEEERDGLLKG